jgi:hypothetical protein
MIMCCLVRGVAHLRVRSVWSSGVMILCRGNLKKRGEKSVSEPVQTPQSDMMLPAIELRLHAENLSCGNFGSNFELFSWCLCVFLGFM